MSEATIEQRLSKVESQLSDLMTHLGQPKREKDWRRTIGKFAGQFEMQPIFDEAQRLRDEDRKRFYVEYDREQGAQ